MTRILVVDDEPQLLRGLRLNLEARGLRGRHGGRRRSGARRGGRIDARRRACSTWGCPTWTGST